MADQPSTTELQGREKWLVYADGDCLLTTHSRERAHRFTDTLGPDWKSIWIEHVVTTQERIRVRRVRERKPMMVSDTENTLVYDRNRWLWQRRVDKWQCVTQEVGGPPTRNLDELVRDYGPLTEVRAV